MPSSQVSTGIVNLRSGISIKRWRITRKRQNSAPIFNLTLSKFTLKHGRLSEAIDAAKSAIQECIKNHNLECQAGGLADLAEVERKNGDLAAAASSLKEARRLAPGIKDVYFQGSLLYREAGQQRAEGHLEQALKTYQELISLIERVKGQGDVKSQRALSETYGYIYDELSSTLYAMSAGKSDPDRTRLASLALQYTETNKAREFANTWGRTFVTELRRTLPSDLQEKERSLLAERDQLLAAADARKRSRNWIRSKRKWRVLLTVSGSLILSMRP